MRRLDLRPRRDVERPAPHPYSRFPLLLAVLLLISVSACDLFESPTVTPTRPTATARPAGPSPTATASPDPAVPTATAAPPTATVPPTATPEPTATTPATVPQGGTLTIRLER